MNEYDAQVADIVANKAGRVVIPASLRLRVLTCDVAMTDFPVRVPGDMVIFDANSSASGASFRLNSSGEGSIPILPNGGISDTPMKDIFITCTAQSGKVLNLWYGYRARFIFPNSLSDIADRAARLLGIVFGTLGQLAQQLLGGVNAAVTTDRGFAYGASYKSTSTLAANTADIVVAPGTNVNGVILWDGCFETTNSGAHIRAGFLAKASAPGSIIDGDVLIGTSMTALDGTARQAYGKAQRAVFVAAGKGVYFITDAVETSTYRSALVTIL